MKRKLLVIIGLFIGTTAMMAAPVTVEQAQQQARQFLARQSAKVGSQHHAPAQYSLTAADRQADGHYYVFNVGRQQGFVIVSGDDRTAPVLGYSDSGSFDPQNIPENMREWLQSCADQMEQLDKQGFVQSQNAPLLSVRMPIAPLMKSLWNQGTPYNNQTPTYKGQVFDHRDSDGNAVYVDGDIHCVTGCVATAMAQLMYYHKWPVSATKEIPAYTSKTKVLEISLDALPATTFDWSHMYDTYDSDSEDTEEVAKLMRYCGQSVEMNYGISSSANTAYAATVLVDYFDYDAQIQVVSKSDYRYAQWVDLVYQELAAERPVLFSGQSISSGHAFICDGYNEDDYFHINWGWGGLSNGYFKLSLLSPSEQGAGGSATSDGFNLWQSIVIGIQPNTGYVPETPRTALTITSIATDVTTVTRSSASTDFTGIAVTHSRWNKMDADYTFDIGLGLYQGEELVKELYKRSSSSNLPSGWGYSALTSNVSFGAGLPDGEYTIKAISREQDSGDWLFDYQADEYYVNANISDNTLTLDVVKPEAKVVDLKVNSVTFTGSKKSNESQEVVVNITNNGTFYSGDLTMTLNNSQVAGIQLEMEPGETRNVSFNFTPTISGTNIPFTIIQGFFNYGSAIYNGTVNLEAGAAATRDVELTMAVDVENKSDDSNYIYGTTAHLKVNASNETELNCNGRMVVQVYKWTRSGSSWSRKNADIEVYKNFTVNAGSSTQFNLSLEGLEEGGEYSFSAHYLKDSWISFGDIEKTYIVKPGYNLYDAEGNVRAAEATAALDVPATAAVVDLRGQSTVTSIKSLSNPNTLFLVDEGQTLPAGATNVVTDQVAENIELTDGYDFYAPFAFTAENISYTRTFTTGYKPGAYGWETMVLPFTIEKVTADGKEIDWFHSASDTGKQFWVMQFDGDDGSNTVNFVQCGEHKPYIPYLVAVPGDYYGTKALTGNKIVFSGTDATIRANSDARTAVTGSGYKLVGTQSTLNSSNIYTLDSEGHQFAKGTYEVKSFHAFITPTNIGQATAASLGIGFGSQTAGINSLAAGMEQRGAAGVYTLGGVKVADSLDRLPAGIYIVNGKKVVK